MSGQISRNRIAYRNRRYLLGQALGSLVLPPFTEAFGRRPSYITGCALYSISNIVVAAPNHIAGVVVGRFLSGFVSALPSTVACGSLEDIWDARARIWALSIYIIFAVMSLGVGPPVATYLATSPIGWSVRTVSYPDFLADVS